MKKILLFVVMAFQSLLWSAEASAAPCTVSAVASYVALGSGGCTIGSFVFSDFKVLPPANGAVASTALTVTPIIVGTTVVGVSFGVAPTASGGAYYDDLISYRVTGAGSKLTGATVDFTGSSTTGDAAVSVNENLCLGGVFAGADGVSGCSGNPLDIAVVNVFGAADPAFTQAFAAGVGSLSVVTDIAYDSGSGFAGPSASTLTSAINRFSVVAAPAAVPEPAAAALLAAGLIGLVGVRRKPGRARRRPSNA